MKLRKNSTEDFLSLVAKLGVEEIFGVATLMGVSLKEIEDDKALWNQMGTKFQELNRERRRALMWILKEANKPEGRKKLGRIASQINPLGSHSSRPTSEMEMPDVTKGDTDGNDAGQ